MADALPDVLSNRPVILDVQELSIDYVSKNQPPAEAVRDVSFTLRGGEVLGLVGESGCGKSTLMLGLMRLLPPAGRIVGGQVLLQRTRLACLERVRDGRSTLEGYLHDLPGRHECAQPRAYGR